MLVSGKMSQVLMDNTSGKLSVVGEKVKVSSWWVGPSSNFHTLQIKINNFTGRIGIQGSLMENPTENDWFYIYLTINNKFLIFPRENTNDITKGETANLFFSFIGNFMWIRAIMDRNNLNYVPDNNELLYLGYVDKIILSR